MQQIFPHSLLPFFQRKSQHVVKIFITLVFLGMGSVGWGQVTIHNNPCTAATSGWTFTNGITTLAIQQGGYWLLEDADVIISQAFDVSSYTGGLTLDFQVATYGSGSANPCFVEYSIDDGVTWSTNTFTSATPSSSSFISSGTFSISASTTTKFKLKFRKSGTSGRDVRLKDIILKSVAPTCTAPTITFPSADTRTWGAAPYTINATSNSLGIFTYTSSDPAVASISGNTVTLKKDGTTIITASQAANGSYCAGSATQTLKVNPSSASPGWAEIELPFSGSIFRGDNFSVKAQVYMAGVTESAGAGAGITAWIGYNSMNADPSAASGWTWVPATFNAQNGNNDEFTAQIGSSLPSGNYFYASRFQYYGGPFIYGAVGGIWNGTGNNNGSLTVNPNLVDYCNLQFPANATIPQGGSVTVYAQVYKSGVTEPIGQGANINGWIGYSSTNNDPGSAGWTWVPAIFNTPAGNNDEYKADIGSSLTPGTYYYASRFQYKNDPMYTYGGYSATGGGFWGGSNISGVLTVVQPVVTITSGAFNKDFGNICVNSASVSSTYSVSGNNLLGNITITAPPGFRIKTGAGAWGTSLTLTQTAGSVPATNIDVQFLPTTATSFNGNISHASANASTVTQNVTGTGIANQTPTVTISRLPTGTICAGTSVTFNAVANNTGTGMVGYQWILNGVIIPGETSVNYTTSALSNNDNVACKITISGGCVTATTATSSPITVSVNSIPPTPGGISGAATPCIGSSSVYSISSVTGATAYTWVLPSGWSISSGSGSNSITVTVGSGSGNLSVTANNTCGNSSPQNLAVVPVVTPATAVATSGTFVGSNSFTANWNTVVTASGYYLDVYQYLPGSTAVAWTFPTNGAIVTPDISSVNNSSQILITNATSGISDVTGATTQAATATGWDAGNGTKYWQVSINTIGFKDLKFTSKQRSSSSGPKNFKVQYKIGAGIWADVAAGAVTVADNFTTGFLDSLTLPGACDNQTSVFLRWIMTSNTAVGGGTVGGGGTSRIDDIYIVGSNITYVSGFENAYTTDNYLEIDGLNPATNYFYVVRAANGACVSANSNEISITTSLPCTPIATITSFSPATGPVGTRITLKGAGFTGATNVKIGGIVATYEVKNDNTIIAQIPAGASVGKVNVTVSSCDAVSPTNFITLFENGNCGTSGGVSSINDIFISKVYDASSGSLSYIEIFNGTNASVDLGAYVLRVTTGTNTNSDYALSTTLAKGATYLIRIGSGTTCTGLSPNLNLTSAPGFNGNDRIYLRKGGVNIDYVPNPNYGGKEAPGFSQARKAATTAANIPSTTYTPSDWVISTTENCEMMFVPPYIVGGSTVTITAQPTDVGCNTIITLSVSASSSPTNTPTYVWKFNDPSTMSGWDNVSIINTTPYNYPVTVSGVGTSTITIIGSTAELQNFQFYVEVKAPATTTQCVQSSNAAQYQFNSLPLYQTKNSGNWTNPNTWEMSSNGSTWSPVCNYPVAKTSTKITVKHDVLLNTKLEVNNLVVDAGKSLELGNTSKVTINESVSGADFVLNGTLLDRASSGNGIAFNDPATWILGSAANVILTNTSSAAVYRDMYEGGIANITSTANWYYRFNGDGNPTVTSSGMTYPNLYFENTANTSLFEFKGFLMALKGSSKMTIKGNLNIGSTGTGKVKIYNNNIAINPMLVEGSTNIGVGSTLTNEPWNPIISDPDHVYGTGFEIKGDITNTGTLVANSDGKGLLRMSGNSNQSITGSGNFYLYDVDISNTSGAKTILNTTINRIDHQLNLVSGKFELASGSVVNMSGGSGINASSGDFNNTIGGKIVFKGNSQAFTGTINFYPDVYLTLQSPYTSSGVNFGPTSVVHNLLEINTNGYVNVNAPRFVSGSLLKYNTSDNYDRSVEWSNPSGNGFPYNVLITGNTIFNPAKGDASFQNTDFNTAGDVTIDGGSSIRMDYGIGASVNGMLKSLIIGKDLLINGDLYGSIQIGGDIKVNGNWTRGLTGNFYPNDRAVFFIGSGNSSITVKAPERRDSFPYLILDKNTIANLLSLNDSITVTKKFTFSKGTLQLNNADFTFQSNAENTASITALNAASTVLDYNGTGQFTVERYMPVNKKAWHLLSAPTKGSTFKSAWQEGSLNPYDNPKPGFGTSITDSSSSWKLDGFDVKSFLPSVKYYDPTAKSGTGAYVGIDKTTDQLNNNLTGYFVFVRGDRSVTGATEGGKTTLRTKGKIYAPGIEAPPTIPLTNINHWKIIGNPYPSAIKFTELITKGLTEFYYVWDPKLAGRFGTGAFRTISNLGLVVPDDPLPAPGTYPVDIIESGQAFFVQANSVVETHNISFPETAKIDGSDNRVFYKTDINPYEKLIRLRGNLYSLTNGERELLDGNMTLFSSDFSSALDASDAEKFPNSSENMGVLSGGKIIAIESRALPSERDTLFYHFTLLKTQNYQLEFVPVNMEAAGMVPYLKDKYLNTDLALSAGINHINIKIENIEGSKAADRFYVYFKPTSTNPVTLVSLNAVEKNGDVLVTWKVENEKDMLNYTVEVSVDGNNFKTGGVVSSRNVNAGSYQWTDVSASPGYHYYRLKMVGKDGKISYSAIVKVLIGNDGGKSLIAIYPNPIVNNEVRVQLDNQPEGLYKARLLNSAGQFVQSMNFDHAGGSSIELLVVKNKMASGVYHLEISRSGEKVFGGKVIVP